MVDANDSSPRGGRERSDFQESVERLEKAVQDLVGSATSEFSERATSLVDEITNKLEREFKPGRRQAADFESRRLDDDLYDPAFGSVEDDLYDPGGAAERMRARRRARRRTEQRLDRTARLYRDPEHAKIGGVCAGIARYYGMESWVVRCIAVTGLLFLPSIVFPAYWVAYFVMDVPPRNGRPDKRRRSNRRDHSPTAPELGPELSPRRSLRNVTADLNQAELRLRRMESHVTSGQYELQRELNRIDAEPAPPAPPAGAGTSGRGEAGNGA